MKEVSKQRELSRAILGSEDMCSSTVGRDTTQAEQPVYIGPGCYNVSWTRQDV